MARQLAVYFSLHSPWAYVGHGALQALVAKHNLRVDYRPVALSQIFPELGGLPLAKRHPLRQNYRIVELQRWREKRGLKFPPPSAILALRSRARRPDRLRHDLAGVDPRQIHLLRFRRRLRTPEDVGAAETLAQILEKFRLSRGAGCNAARAERRKTCYQRNLALALEAGVFGSPSYVLDGEVFWGQDRLDLLDDA